MAGKKTGDVLAAARRDLKAQLKLVQGDLANMGREERALAKALASLKGDRARSSPAAASTSSNGSDAAKPTSRRRSARKTSASRRRRSRGASKSTVERLEELRGHLAEGPKSRNDLAAALKVSPPRVQQLLAELGSSVSSQPASGHRNGKLWSLNGGTDGARTRKPATKRSATKRPAARKRTARKT